MTIGGQPSDGTVLEHGTPRVALRGARKSFGGVQALTDATVVLYSGQTLALVGENGAGKSTVVKILGGIHQADEGELRLDGSPVTLRSPAAAQAAGIAVIHQEPTLFASLTVAENIFMGRQPLSGAGTVAWSRMNREAQVILRELDSPLSPTITVGALSIAEQQIVEIAKALSQQARVLIMDEPTAALSGTEVQDLLQLVAQLNQRGVAVLYISHRLNEVLAVSHEISVLRDGTTVDCGPVSEFDEKRIIKGMVGRALDEIYPPLPHEFGQPMLTVEGLSRPGEYRDISFSVRQGEIVGLAGLIGAGRTEIARSLFGLTKPAKGTVIVSGQRATIRNPRQAKRAGIAYVPEDRRQHGLVMPFGVDKNTSLASLARFSKAGFLSRGSERGAALDAIRSLGIRASGPGQIAGTLSGGNQQKVVLGKWLQTHPKVLILDEPTRGVDVGAKSEVYRIIAGLAAEGLAVVLISSELPEVLAMSHRIIVLREGSIAGELPASQATQESVMALATGSASARESQLP